MGYQEHKSHAPQSTSCALITISDTRTAETDDSGRIIREKLEEKGHKIVSSGILKDDAPVIRERIQHLLNDKEVQVIITNGGTGISKKDVTIEAISPLLEKRLEGFGEIFRFLSYQEIGSSSMMSRALAGIARGKVVICLPGSVGAVQLAVEKLVLPEIGHMVWEVTR